MGSLARAATAFMYVFGATSCVAASRDDPASLDPLAPPAECEVVWDREPASAFVRTLVAATSGEDPVWMDYGPSGGSYVLLAGASETGASCLGAWREGEAVGFAALPEEPALLTPLYGYHFGFEANGGPFDPLIGLVHQPPAVRAWLDSLGLDRAVILPVEIEGLPFEVPTLKKVQIAIHEAFHLDVQAPQWFGSTDRWPDWDLQPDRAGVPACYTHTPEVVDLISAERAKLVELVTALLDGRVEAACETGRAFLDTRATRYRELAELRIDLHDGSPGSCEQAEAIMEIEEGGADYASWVPLFDRGIATREELLLRYRAQQDGPYYLTGAAQLHAVSLMQGAEARAIGENIARSTSYREGSPTARLDGALRSFCDLAVEEP